MKQEMAVRVGTRPGALRQWAVDHSMSRCPSGVREARLGIPALRQAGDRPDALQHHAVRTPSYISLVSKSALEPSLARWGVGMQAWGQSFPGPWLTVRVAVFPRLGPERSYHKTQDLTATPSAQILADQIDRWGPPEPVVALELLHWGTPACFGGFGSGFRAAVLRLQSTMPVAQNRRHKVIHWRQPRSVPDLPRWTDQAYKVRSAGLRSACTWGIHLR